jgi:hypothetical protein
MKNQEKSTKSLTNCYLDLNNCLGLNLMEKAKESKIILLKKIDESSSLKEITTLSDLDLLECPDSDVTKTLLAKKMMLQILEKNLNDSK